MMDKRPKKHQPLYFDTRAMQFPRSKSRLVAGRKTRQLVDKDINTDKAELGCFPVRPEGFLLHIGNLKKVGRNPQRSKTMKTRIAVLTMLVAGVMALSVPTHAATPVGTPEVAIASVTVGGVPEITFSIDLRDVADPITDTNPPEIGWSVNAGDDWTIANQLIQLDHTITDINGGIQIYTDNASGVGTTAYPNFVDPTVSISTNSDSNPAGLVWVNGTDTSGNTLPVAWSIKDSTKVVGAEIVSADPNENGLCGKTETQEAFQWLLMMDANTPAIDWTGDGDVLDVDPDTDCDGENLDSGAFADGLAFVTVARWQSPEAGKEGLYGGIHGAQGPDDFFGSPTGRSYVYLQADFSNAAPLHTYNTNSITVEAYTH